MSVIAYNAPPTLGRFLGSDDVVRLIVGPVGSGKSSGCCVEIIRRSIEMPPCPDGVKRSRWCIVRNTYRELEDTTINTWKAWVPEGPFGRWRASDHVFELRFETDDGSRIEAEVLFRSLDRPDDVKKLLSLEVTGFYFNEAKEIPKAIWDVAQTRIGRYPRKEDVSRYWTGIFGDTNPFDTDHWMYKLFEEDRDEEGNIAAGHKLFKQPSGLSAQAENIENLDRCWDPTTEDLMAVALEFEPGTSIRDDRVRRRYRSCQAERLLKGEHEKPCRCYYVRQCAGKDQDFINVMVKGEYGFVKLGKTIYPEFIDGVHVSKTAIPINPRAKLIRIGNDYGLTPAAVWVQQDPADGQYQVVREFVSERLGAANFAKEQARICKTEFAGHVFAGFGDPAGNAASPTDEEETPILIVNAAGVPMEAAPTNEFTLRREAVAGPLTTMTMLGRPALVISPTCKVLRKAMSGGYCFKRLMVTGEARYKDAPDKNMYSHVAEALQYAMVGAGEDRRAIDGGEERRERVTVRVHRSVGGAASSGQDLQDEDYHPIRVRSSVK